ncbi:cytochrome C oxidase subunit IV family protein [Nocardia carnea]|uniref:cytochrome C oxidase subunit IV family protein n=1 Tax=Nocardia carnea TaxID=37328 RepID=UPI0024572DAA|nr:cytochrome C oxidase subunit IV family protein [Nocardia carnea]
MTTSNTTQQPRYRRDKQIVILAWAALTAITLLAWQLTPGHTPDPTSTGKELVAVIVVLGLIKCRIILRYFMEIRNAPRWLQLCTDAWLLVLWAALLGIYLY